MNRAKRSQKKKKWEGRKISETRQQQNDTIFLLAIHTNDFQSICTKCTQ